MGLRNLIVRITGDNSSLKQSLNESEQSVQGFGSRAASWLKGAFAVGAVVEFGRRVVETYDALSDKFEIAIAGVKEALWKFGNNLANLDFSNFIGSLNEAYNEGKKLAEQLDALAERRAYDDYILTLKRQQSAELRETIKNKALDLDVRKKAAADRQKLEQEIFERTKNLDQKEFDLAKEAWAVKNKQTGLSPDEAARITGVVNAFPEDIRSRMETGYQSAAGIMGKQGAYEYLMSGKGRDIFGNTGNLTPDQITDFIKYSNMLMTGEKDTVIKLFESYKAYSEAKIDAQERFNAVLKETTGLEIKQDETYANLPKAALLPSGGFYGNTIDAQRQAINRIFGFNPDTVGLATKGLSKSQSKATFDLNSGLTDTQKLVMKLTDQFSSYRDWETDRKSTRLNSSHSGESRMPSSS